VSEDAGKHPNPFDVQTIKQLVALMTRHDLSEVDLRDGQARLRLRRGPRRNATVPAPAAPIAPPAPSASLPETAAPSSPREASAPARTLVEIKSPTVGIFYAAAKPGAEPLVRVGTRVSPTTVVGLVEAMKIFNEVQAECSGVIAEVLVENEQAVEWGQVLFRVDPTG
jgi:acetyl-CoA carboxylase biotin carboxyl carrier protein